MRAGLVVACFLALLASPAVAGTPQRFQTYFLAVGSTFYAAPTAPDEHGFADLHGANKSARRVADILSGHGSTFGIVLTSEQDKLVSISDIWNALDIIGARIRADRKPNPLIVFYIAAHGISDGVAWNHFSVPGDFVYRGDVHTLDIEALSTQTLHAAALADRLDKLGVPYLVILDTCYEGEEANFNSPVLTPQASTSLSGVAAALRVINEFRQPNPVVFSSEPGNVVSTVPDPEDPKSTTVGPLARRMTLLFEPALPPQGMTLKALVAGLTAADLDPATAPAITKAEAAPNWANATAWQSETKSEVRPMLGTGRAPQVCCGDPAAPADQQVTRLSGRIVLEGASGEDVTGGRTIVIADQQTVLVTRRCGALILAPEANSDNWEIDIAAPHDAKLQAGGYAKAQRYPFQDDDRAGLAITGAGTACNEVTGTIHIAAIAYDKDDKLSTLSAKIFQLCDDNPAPLTATVDLRTPAP